ncbi:MAG: ABC transporter substrate-binding protein [Granulosicoccus sp.]|nr:ABC transporter substrate-binding protein [Granulosicoccus sp.]
MRNNIRLFTRCIRVCLLLTLTPAALQANSAPISVASINLCTDQLLILLADPEQIASLSNLSHESAGSYYYQQARNYPINKGLSEQILPLKPDLVLAGSYTPTHTLTQLRSLGLQVEIVPIANSFESMLNNISSVAQWINQSARGDAIISDLQNRLTELNAPPDHPPSVAIYDPNGYTVGANTLRGQLLELSGWINIASEAGIDSYGSLSLETLVRHAPDALIDSPYSENTYSRGQDLTRHPAIRQAGLNPHIISIPSRMTICAGPWTMDVIEMLQQERKQLMENYQWR